MANNANHLNAFNYYNKENNMNIFDNKEQYIAFNTKWKQLYKENFHKPKSYPIYEFDYKKYRRTDNILGYYKHSDLDATFHLVYAIAMSKDLNKGFGRATYKLRSKIPDYSCVFGKYPCTATKKVFQIFEEYFTDNQKILINVKMKGFLLSLKSY